MGVEPIKNSYDFLDEALLSAQLAIMARLGGGHEEERHPNLVGYEGALAFPVELAHSPGPQRESASAEAALIDKGGGEEGRLCVWALREFCNGGSLCDPPRLTDCTLAYLIREV